MTCFRQYSVKGITSVGIAGSSPSTFRVMQELRDMGNPVRVGFMFSADSFDKLRQRASSEALEMTGCAPRRSKLTRATL